MGWLVGTVLGKIEVLLYLYGILCRIVFESLPSVSPGLVPTLPLSLHWSPLALHQHVRTCSTYRTFQIKKTNKTLSILFCLNVRYVF